MARTLKLILYYFLFQLGCSCLVTFFHYGLLLVRLRRDSGTWSFPDLPADVNLIILSTLAGNLLCAGYLISKRHVALDRRTWSFPPADVLAAVVVLTLGLILCMNYVMEQLALPDRMANTFLQMKDHAGGIVAIALVAPVAEEMLFRGAIEGHLLRQWRSPWAAVGMSALAFALVHLNLAQIPFAFALGLVLGWLYQAGGSLVPCIVLHLVNNGVSVALMIAFPEQSGSMEALTGAGRAPFFACAGALAAAACLLFLSRRLPVWAARRKECE